MAEIEKDIHIAAPIEAVWAALTEPAAIMAWMGEDSEVAVDLRVGGRYQFYYGATTGEFTLIEPPRRLSYTWRQTEWESHWPSSVVAWTLTPDEAGTQVHLRHHTFPDNIERDGHEVGWDLYWLNLMKDWLEAPGE